MMQINLKMAQLLSSRLCHDLIGPVVAISGGLELMEEGMEDTAPALELMAKSASQATRRLAFFRIAFGSGAGEGGEATLAEARDLAAGLLADGKVVLDWPENAEAQPGGPVPPSLVKVVLNMVLMASESLPRGGAVGINFAALDEGLGVAVAATGDGVALKDDISQAMAKTPGELTTRNVHAHFAQALARDLGAQVEHSQGKEGEIRLSVLFPDATGR